jgi:hypothetical protein
VAVIDRQFEARSKALVAWHETLKSSAAELERLVLELEGEIMGKVKANRPLRIVKGGADA